MQQTQIVTYGIDGVLAARLRDMAQAKRIWLRETAQLAACKNLVETTAPPVVILVLGGDLERELAFIEQIHATMPGTAVVVVGEADNPTLAGLAWDLGAAFVLFPPMRIDAIDEVISRIIEGASP